MTTEIFGARLRHERERRGIPLSSVADRTKISPAFLVSLERGDLTRLPGGLYRRSFLRGYAEAVGLDPEEVLRECLPDPADTPAAADGPPGEPAPTDHAVSQQAGPASRLRVRIDPAPHLCRGGPLLAEARHRIMAIAADLVILGGISTGFWLTIDNFWAPLAIAMAAYYTGGILILGNTPGVSLSAAVAADGPTPAEAGQASHA